MTIGEDANRGDEHLCGFFVSAVAETSHDVGKLVVLFLLERVLQLLLQHFDALRLEGGGHQDQAEASQQEKAHGDHSFGTRTIQRPAACPRNNSKGATPSMRYGVPKTPV